MASLSILRMPQRSFCFLRFLLLPTESFRLRWFALFVLASSGLSADEARLLTITNFSSFQRESSGGNTVTLTSRELVPGFPWRELIVSWNVATHVAMSVEARPVLPGGARFLSLGHWTAVPGPDSPRQSLNGQKEAWGEVQTDLMVLREPASAAQIRLEIRGPESGLRRVSLAFSSGNPSSSFRETNRTAWGRELAVPVRSQAEFPEGITKWCSPTSTTMLMAYWGEQRGKVAWIPAVPDTANGVFDPGWGGTGNWPFNMAFAGGFPGLNAVVARWRGVADLERWIASGLPAAASVSYAMLKGGGAAEAGDGHLVVVCGFTSEGDVVVNDPGVRRERVRRVFPRADFDRAWAHSARTVYLVWPDGEVLPEGPVFPR